MYPIATVQQRAVNVKQIGVETVPGKRRWRNRRFEVRHESNSIVGDAAEANLPALQMRCNIRLSWVMSEAPNRKS